MEKNIVISCRKYEKFLSQTKKANKNQFVCRRARLVKLLKIIRVYRLASKHGERQTETLEVNFRKTEFYIAPPKLLPNGTALGWPEFENVFRLAENKFI